MMPDSPAPAGQQPATPTPGQPQNPPPMPEWMKITMASMGGMATSLAAFVAFTAMQSASLRGQLVPGDAGVNSQYPTLHNTIQASLTGNNSIVTAMSSYLWWTGVLVGGAVLSFVFLRMMRARLG